jgi:hypothetical protein
VIPNSMSSDVPIWQFSAHVASERAKFLLSYPSFDAVALLLEQQATVEGFVWERFSGQALQGCHRASFCLRVPEATYDAFFNSPAGYRGQYAVSPTAGEAANRKLLVQLEPHLLTYATSHSQVAQAVVRRSLRAAQAKLWILEPDVEAQLGSTAPAIVHEQWNQASASGVGLLAPVAARLEVKGGWLAPNGDERINPAKADRSEEIHRTGFT